MAGIVATAAVYSTVYNSSKYGSVFLRSANFSNYLNKPGIVSDSGCNGTSRYFLIIDEYGQVVGHGVISPDGTLTPTPNSVMNDAIMPTNNTSGTSTKGGPVYYSAKDKRVYVRNVDQNGILVAQWKLPGDITGEVKSTEIANAPLSLLELKVTSDSSYNGSTFVSINSGKNYGNQEKGWVSPYTTFGPWSKDIFVSGRIDVDDNILANGITVIPYANKPADLAGSYYVKGFISKGSTFSLAAQNTSKFKGFTPCGFQIIATGIDASILPSDEIEVGTYIIRNPDTTNWDNYCDVPDSLDITTIIKKGTTKCLFNTVGCCDLSLNNPPTIPPGYWGIYDTCVPYDPIQDKCKYTCWTPCRESKCKGEQFVQTRSLISGPLEICFGDYDSLVSRVVYGLYEPTIDIEWVGEGDGIPYNKGGTGIKKGITRGWAVFKYPANPDCEGKCSYSYSTPQVVATGQNLCSSPTIGINDGTYESKIIPTGVAPPPKPGYRRGFYAFRSENVFSSTECRDVDPGDMDEDKRGVQFHPDGDSSYFYEIANGSMGCLSFSQGGEKTLYDFYQMSTFCYGKNTKIKYNISTNPNFTYECNGKTRTGRPGSNTQWCGSETKKLNPPNKYYPPKLNPDIPLKTDTNKNEVFLETTYLWNGPGTLTVNNKPDWANIELLSDNKTLIIYGNPPGNVVPGTYTIDFSINNEFGEKNNSPANYNFYIDVKPSKNEIEELKSLRQQKLLDLKLQPLG